MTDYINLRKIVTGDIIVKCQYKDDIRRIPISQVPTYDELCLMMFRVFKSKFSSVDDIGIKYKDDEGDMISLLDDVDITHAISISNLLKITLFDKKNEVKEPVGGNVQLSSLIEIRDRLNSIIDSLNKQEEKSSTKTNERKQEEQVVRKLTPSELAEFLPETASSERSVTTEVNTPGISSNIPYYPPPQPMPTSQMQAQSTKKTPVTHNAPSQPPPQQQQQQQQQKQQQQQPIPYSNNYPSPYSTYQRPPSQNNDTRVNQQRQSVSQPPTQQPYSQQPPLQSAPSTPHQLPSAQHPQYPPTSAYYVPPPPQYRPTHW
ncbi:hypothetical protein BDB01DRAFT_568367 [Pilobolus umbonatus]|nr:hypothetical protein BDB01DRAFT_568367 [Pilobolus umbonatus]